MTNLDNLKEKYEQKGQVDYLPTGSQPDPTEALDVGPPTSSAHTEFVFHHLNTVILLFPFYNEQLPIVFLFVTY